MLPSGTCMQTCTPTADEQFRIPPQHKGLVWWLRSAGFHVLKAGFAWHPGLLGMTETETKAETAMEAETEA